MTIHVLVEGPAERALLDWWAPRLLSGRTVKVHPHQGKGKLPANPHAPPDPKHRGLLDQLPAKLRAYANVSQHEPIHVVVLLDADDEDPAALAESISKVAKQVSPGLAPLVRLAVEETEAFYLGDLAGIKKAYPNANMERARAYVPDSICNTWELFGRVVNDGGENKVAWAEAMGPVLTTKASASRSPSFKDLVQGLLGLASQTEQPAPRKKYRHLPKPRSETGKRR